MRLIANLAFTCYDIFTKKLGKQSGVTCQKGRKSQAGRSRPEGGRRKSQGGCSRTKGRSRSSQGGCSRTEARCRRSQRGTEKS